MTDNRQQITAPLPRRTRMEILGTRESVLRTGRSRLVLAGLGFALVFTVLTFRLVTLTANGTGDEAQVAQVSGIEPVAAERADILDRNGSLLATNLKAASLHADTQVVPDPVAAADALAQVLPEVGRPELLEKLRSGQRFVWLKRLMTPRQQDAVNRLGIPGLYFRTEERRVYPYGRAAAHVLGFTDIDGNGIAGVEKFFDDRLRRSGADTRPLRLSIDLRVQHALYDELSRAVAEFDALGAAGLVMDAGSGEVLALASLPDFDPNHPGASPGTNRFNRATLGVYELGSVFKPFTVAMALDNGTTRLKDGYDATSPIRVARFTIRDDHPKKRWLSVPEILMYSSNIGAAKMALDVGGDRQQDYFARLGLLSRPRLELPEVGLPLSPAPWRDINVMTASFGHGVAVSPLQMTAAFGALVNGGVLVRPTVLRADDRPAAGERAISEKTSKQMRRLLRLVVTDGTGRKADVPGFLVGGKTGTAEKAGAGGYQRKALLSSFVAAFPMTAPRYVIYALLDEPQGTPQTHGFASAGWTAAPVAGRVIARIGPLLGMHPVDGDSAAVREAMAVKVISREPKLASY
jgi:cell division protein FtsI (penicillin-binding protein 3)